ncbi:MAG TPA: hypothetical protein VN634_20540 [Candidatus Limnocylindrales bacterium]|nr:hypothetical protein [Candidatus Limnocylindrales bacterium]
MKRISLAAMSAMFVIAIFASGASAAEEDLLTKKFSIKDHPTDATKRQIQLFSHVSNIQYTDADNPKLNGASVHVWSATDNFCYVLTADSELWLDNGNGWKYKNPDTKNQAQISDGKLLVKIRSGVTFTLADDFPQNTVNASVQFGPGGSRFCMHCTGTDVITDDEKKFQGKECAQAVCDAEPPGCLPVATTTTTTSTTTTTTSTTTTTTLGTVVGALTKTAGRFNYNLMAGLPAAEAACASNFAGAHVCSYPELVVSQGPPMTGLKDTAMNTVTDLWAVNPARPSAGQCAQSPASGDPRWVYNTGHLGVGGDVVSLTNATGALGALVLGGDGNPGGRNCLTMHWVACCHS